MKVARHLRMPASGLALLLAGFGVSYGQDLEQNPNRLTPADLVDAHPVFHSPAVQSKALAKSAANAALTSAVQGIDSVPNFDGSFDTPGFDSNDKPNTRWFYNMLGQPPARGGTTTLNAPIIPVSVLLLDANGKPAFDHGHLLFADANQFVQPTVDSPVFTPFLFSTGGTPTQFTDAVQRAEFWKFVQDTNGAPNDWHTVLAPNVKQGRLMLLPFGSYKYILNKDGSCCLGIEADINTFSNLLIPETVPVDGTTTIGAAELANDITTKDVSTFLFPSVYLTFPAAKGQPPQCCVIGFHEFDSEPGTKANGNREQRFVFNYASWIQPGFFGGDDFQDVLALSHELSESFNDPFVAVDNILNITPWWKSGGNCQNNLEVGDVVEVFPHPSFPVEVKGFTYHPQTVALLQWFEFQKHSTAFEGAYSYPGTDILTELSPVEHANCAAK